MSQPTPVIIDCDPGIDDAVALLLALASPEVELVGITTVAGNTSVDNTTANALRLLDLVGRSDVPVHAGADRPLVHVASEDASEFHGETGLGDCSLPPPSRPAGSAHAIDFIARSVMESSRPITLIAVGPLTNVALLVARYPEVVDRLGDVVVMGGAHGEGNVTPAAEFNIWVDPEAAQRVVDSGLSPTFVGLDVTHQANIGPDDVAQIGAMGRCGAALAQMLATYERAQQKYYGSSDLSMHDSLAVAHVIDPSLLTRQHVHVAVDTGSSISRGATLVDRWGFGGAQPNAHWSQSVDSAAFHKLLMTRLALLP